MKSGYMAAALLASLLISSCQYYGRPSIRTGVIIGGLPGKGHGIGPGRTHATIVGPLIGFQIGGSVGRLMDDGDRLKIAMSLETIRTGVPTIWTNPDTRYEYSLVPTRTFQRATTMCREYTIDARIDGKTEQVFGTACRQADGAWKLQG